MSKDFHSDTEKTGQWILSIHEQGICCLTCGIIIVGHQNDQVTSCWSTFTETQENTVYKIHPLWGMWRVHWARFLLCMPK